jgi:hypothetical protein
MPYYIYLEGFDVLFSPWLLLLVIYKLSDDCSLKNNDEHLLLSKKKVKRKLLNCFGGFFIWMSKNRDGFFPLKNAMIHLQKILKLWPFIMTKTDKSAKISDVLICFHFLSSALQILALLGVSTLNCISLLHAWAQVSKVIHAIVVYQFLEILSVFTIHDYYFCMHKHQSTLSLSLHFSFDQKRWFYFSVFAIALWQSWHARSCGLSPFEGVLQIKMK